MWFCGLQEEISEKRPNPPTSTLTCHEDKRRFQCIYMCAHELGMWCAWYIYCLCVCVYVCICMICLVFVVPILSLCMCVCVYVHILFVCVSMGVCHTTCMWRSEDNLGYGSSPCLRHGLLFAAAQPRLSCL